MNNPKFDLGQRVEVLNEESPIHNGIHFTIDGRKERVRKYDGVQEWAYTGPGMDGIYVSEELLILTDKTEEDD